MGHFAVPRSSSLKRTKYKQTSSSIGIIHIQIPSKECLQPGHSNTWRSVGRRFGSLTRKIVSQFIHSCRKQLDRAVKIARVGDLFGLYVAEINSQGGAGTRVKTRESTRMFPGSRIYEMYGRRALYRSPASCDAESEVLGKKRRVSSACLMAPITSDAMPFQGRTRGKNEATLLRPIDNQFAR